ncbi:4'-phosphopantetheinyl transferase superfamily protein [Gammaproteobacteria bacterium]|nr:4'-phosphopantetheinyl transferase superfamily protein [Gammaproteobacteria bacterium]
MDKIDTPRLEQLQQQLHVWLTVPEDITDPDTLSDYLVLLSEEERERQQRFHFEKDRHSFLVSHALVRKVLSMYVDVDPADWKFSAGEFGRPEIAGPAGVPPLRFNLTHTEGLSACLVTLDVDCGVDAERVGRRGKLQAIADKMFADSELETLAALDGLDYQQQFFTFWTLREAYCKALGTGLGSSKKDYAFEVAGDSRIAISFASQRDDEQRKYWQFKLLRPAVEHLVAVAVRSDSLSGKAVIQQYIVP